MSLSPPVVSSTSMLLGVFARCSMGPTRQDANEHDSVQEDVGVEKGKEDSPSIDDNPHLVVPGEYPNQFAALDSGDENEVASVFDEDEDDLGPRDPPAGDVGAAPDLHFEPTLLAAVGGVDEIERVNVRENVLQDSKYNGWTDPSTITPYPYMDEPYELTGSKKTTRVSMMKSMGQHRWRWKPLRRRRVRSFGSHRLQCGRILPSRSTTTFRRISMHKWQSTMPSRRPVSLKNEL
ncbi:hypothetical protein PR002_g7700 [Phytophthora rubi]|uniref:Uncharacterized protein n=1 Tax=Phytophthora rubi TaxID=129364 RepID=A0A6A3N2K2_9STRA|nr:hypothetical protein PR002_g7700 [Phytophthora rubi]